MKRVAVIHGPNLNMLGERETGIYGIQSLNDINAEIAIEATKLNIEIECYQSNLEGELINFIQQSRGHFDGIILNAAAYTHYSLAIRDTVVAAHIPTVEVHMSNIHKREEFRHKSVISPVCAGMISGFGKNSYILALHALLLLDQ